MFQRKAIRRYTEKIIEYLLKFSGAVTSITILFISIFLFNEGLWLFNTPDIEQGYGLYINSQNPINKLSPEETKKIFDAEVSNWEELGSFDKEIRTFRIDDAFQVYHEEELGENYELLPQKLGEFIAKEDNIIAFLPKQYAPKGSSVKELKAENVKIENYFLGIEWLPTTTPVPLFGVLSLILGTLFVCIIALLIALPLGLGVAIYLAELAGEKQRRILKPVIELLAGIPSVVYGFFGLVVLAPNVQKLFNIPVGETALTGSLILAIMALPSIISISEDALRNIPREMREASLALGASHWQTIYRVVVPYAKSGISAAVVLGIGRAVGETMAVLMVTGNAAVIPHSVFDSVRTIPATIAAELGESPAGGAHYQALYLLGCILFIFTMLMSIVSEFVAKKKNYISKI